jgi:DNA polymerase III subunit beta
MPFVVVSKKRMQSILGACGLISPSRSDVDIFTYTRMIISEQDIQISCMSNTAFYQTSSEVVKSEFKESFSLLVKTDMLNQAVKLFNDDELTFDINPDKSTLIVQGAKSKHTLRFITDKLADFIIPEPSAEAEVEVTLPTDQLLAAVRTALISVGQPKTVFQPQFLSICFTADSTQNKLFVVSTDRYRVSKSVITVTFNSTLDEPKNYLVPPKGLQLLASITTGEDTTLRFESDYLWLQTEGQMLTLRYGDGTYPDYNRIIPQSFTCSFTLDTKEMQNALKQVYLAARANASNKSITFKVSPADRKLTLTAKTEDGYASESTVDIATYEGVEEEWTQMFNAGYLTDYINTLSTDSLLWESNPGKPSVLSPKEKREEEMYLVSGLK